MGEVKRAVEAAIFLSQEPVSEKVLSERLGFEIEEVKKALEELVEDYAERGIVLKKVAGGYRFFTAPDLSKTLKSFVEDRPVKLSRPLLEVLAVIAYNQPITKKDIMKIRGQNCDGAIKSLLEKGLIEVAGRANTPGRPKLYRTTDAFLYHFGLNSIEELPKVSLEEDLNGQD
ncbi:SMC-Scp complex subunit ScpB [Phorcysia thermohydrogeniphila]|uniref:Segregation and condensation protein B n=1 Tax=Phorcysia thermohydrogeniphila TaxID=936138 RepID=A0A4R1GH75_9BACT|nr:SMC-Scp complex subunit ScpB [Phorcysia thermohydrogeniphila]TCK06371.1 segregation and condensation protein B [Phorcysia thermohydrogeniphila]